MTRRQFNALPGLAAAAPPAPTGAVAPLTWLFWDLWHVDGIRGAQLEQGQAKWRPEGTFEDPLFEGFGSYPGVFRHAESGRWRMLYSSTFNPLTLLAAESEDGIHWSPMALPDIHPPEGPKRAPHHIYSIPMGSGGTVFRDPVAADGFPYKMYVRQHGEPVRARALKDPKHEFHRHAVDGGNALYMIEHFLLVSKDGLRWKADFSSPWAKPSWHPEPPLYCYYIPGQKRFYMTTRPGHGERRIAVQSSPDARHWSGPELLLQPDPLDPPITQLYALPVFPYEGQYVGLLWTFHNSSWDKPERYNHMIGQLDCQLAYSFDGIRFQRGLRKPFIALNEPGEPGSGLLQASSMVEHNGELRFYSTAGKPVHGMTAPYRGRKGELHILMHSLRKDGFMYLEARGDWGGMLSKPLALFAPTITANLSAPRGEVRYQLTDIGANPIPGFTFADCVPFRDNDALATELRWKEKSLDEVLRKPIRIEIEFRNARVYAFRGTMHFLDAQDAHLLDDGKPIDPRYFHY